MLPTARMVGTRRFAPLADSPGYVRPLGCAVVVTGHEVPSLLASADYVTWCTDAVTASAAFGAGLPPDVALPGLRRTQGATNE